MPSAFENLFGSVANFRAWDRAGLANTTQEATSRSAEYPTISVECIKCGAKNRFGHVTYRRGWFGREWLESTCARCSRQLRFPTVDRMSRPAPGPEDGGAGTTGGMKQ